MSNLFSQSSSNFIPFTKPDLLHNELPVGTYNINYNEKIGFYLSETEAFTLPPKIYGGNTEYSDTILDTFLNDRKNKITSAVLSGIKGSGKTLTAKQISIKAATFGISTLILNAPFTNNDFIELLTHINKPFILFIDEFDKVFNTDKYLNALLTILDGTVQAHMLCIMTMNSSLDHPQFQFFTNRPGRVYFNINYPSCTDEVIQEYLEENLHNKEDIPKLISFTQKFNDFTLDLLSVIVHEYNKCIHKDLFKLVNILNIKPQAKSLNYNVDIYYVNNNNKVKLTSDYLDIDEDFIYYFFNKENVKLTLEIYKEGLLQNLFNTNISSNKYKYLEYNINDLKEYHVPPELCYLYNSQHNIPYDSIICKEYGFELQLDKLLNNEDKRFKCTFNSLKRTLTIYLVDFDIEIIIQAETIKRKLPSLFIL